MSAADLLKQKPKPTRAEIVEHMNSNICRCGTYQRIVARSSARRGRRDMNKPLKHSALSRRQVMIGAAGLSFAFALPRPRHRVGSWRPHAPARR